MQDCLCGSGKSLLDCCNAFITAIKQPATPEELMRSRYTAYALCDINYIEKTMKSPANDNFNAEETYHWAKQITWIQLEIVNTEIKDDSGIVEFIAHYKHNGKRYVLHEISEFIHEEGQWFYIDGKIPEKKLNPIPSKISRNDACPCGSQKKYKKCCGAIKSN